MNASEFLDSLHDTSLVFRGNRVFMQIDKGLKHIDVEEELGEFREWMNHLIGGKYPHLQLTKCELEKLK